MRLLALVLSLSIALHVAVGSTAIQSMTPTTTSDRALANSAIEKLTEAPASTQSEVLRNVKAGADGIQLAIQSANNKDFSKMLKGIGDALVVFPGALGFAGVAFSVAASAFAVFGSSSTQDPVLASLDALHHTFTQEMDGIKTTLASVSDRVGVVINGIDRILSGLSELPAKIVAEMKLTDVTTMKDKFATVQHAAEQYAAGTLSREQMTAKCDDFQVAALFSELETIVRDEKELFAAKFGTHDNAQATVQLQLLVFYLSVVPLASNCNALKYPIESVAADGKRIEQVVTRAYARAVWVLTPPDRTVRVLERYSPFELSIDVGESVATRPVDGWTLVWTMPAYSYVPPHGVCMEVVDGGKRLQKTSLPAATTVPNAATFCVKSVATDDAPVRIAYAERKRVADNRSLAILQPEVADNFDPLAGRGWTESSMALYASSASTWRRLPQLRVVSDLMVLQAKNAKVTVDEITDQCRALGKAYDRDGDAHSKDYSSAPWTIFCVRYVALTLREIEDPATWTYLSDVKLIDLPASEAREASCPDSGYERDRSKVTIPSKVKKQWFGGMSTLRAYAVCMKWTPLTATSTPSDFVQRVWFDDSQPMTDKPTHTQHEGSQRMGP